MRTIENIVYGIYIQVIEQTQWYMFKLRKLLSSLAFGEAAHYL